MHEAESRRAHVGRAKASRFSDHQLYSCLSFHLAQALHFPSSAFHAFHRCCSSPSCRPWATRGNLPPLYHAPSMPTSLAIDARYSVPDTQYLHPRGGRQSILLCCYPLLRSPRHTYMRISLHPPILPRSSRPRNLIRNLSALPSTLHTLTPPSQLLAQIQKRPAPGQLWLSYG